MEKRGPKTYKPLLLKFNYGDNEKNLIESKEFKEFAFKETMKALSFAIKNNKRKINVWNIGDGMHISINKDKYNKVIESAILFYTEQEQFERCAELKKLIKKI